MNDKFGCNRYPVLSVIPLDRGCSGSTFFHNPGAFDTNGDSLSFELTIPASSEVTFAKYDEPNNSRFYSDYDHGNEAKTGPPIFQVNSLTGLVTWDSPGAIGEYNIAFRIIEWRKDKSTGIYDRISTTIRDMQIIIEECANTKPQLIIPADICVVAGTAISASIFGNDADKSDVKIEAFSEVFSLPADQAPATYTPFPPVFTSSIPNATLNFQWTPSILQVRSQPYQVVFKITDKPEKGAKLVNFKTWTIRVIAPAPVITETTLDVVKHHGVLSWKKYSTANVKAIQVWRRVSQNNFSLSDCQIGMPSKSGFGLITELQPDDTTFRDTNFGNGLAAGAEYCYRLVAIIADTKSIVSNQMCLGPVQRDAPVITHVSVEETATNGKMRISWRRPLGINKAQFPEPYRYDIFRADDFTGDAGIDSVGFTVDTTFVDKNISTESRVFNYRIVLYAKPKFSDHFIPVDTSAVASSVWLSALQETDAIRLHWQDSVPWSNLVPSRPYHLIYRAVGIDPADNDFELIDSANVSEDGFNYVDDGTFNNEALQRNRLYSYRIVTIGTYGNPGIALQKNLSQTISLYPVKDLKPCPVSLAVELFDCNKYLETYDCQDEDFTNTINWQAQFGDGCIIDITGYNVYSASSPESEFTKIASVDDLQYKDEHISSPIRLYKVSAVDVFGSEGPLSDVAFSDSCPYYTLPNIFTPDGDGCNDLFSADFTNTVNEKCQALRPESCPRFVKTIHLTVYNRWGREVYRYASGEGSSIYINWNGKDQNDSQLPAGVYYYVADVDFFALDKNKQHQTIKDWVHIFR
jgi:hypothetical protein